MAHNIDPVLSVVEVLLWLRLLQICVGENSFTEHALRRFANPVFPMHVKPQNERGHHSISYFYIMKGFDDY